MLGIVPQGKRGRWKGHDVNILARHQECPETGASIYSRFFKRVSIYKKLRRIDKLLLPVTSKCIARWKSKAED